MPPRIAVTRSSMPDFEEYCRLIAPLWESRWLTNCGANHEDLSRELEGYLEVGGVSLFVNGHSALECVIEAMRLEGEVITTPFTFASTTHAFVRHGLRPVFCDIKADDFTLDPAGIEFLINENTCAIAPVHVYGNVCDNEAIESVAAKYGLKVIYDAAHAFGVRKNGRGVASFGDASMFSFHATKVFNTIEGGAIASNNGRLHEDLAVWRNFGISGPETVEFAGGNSKMNEFCAVMGLCNLKRADVEISRRRCAFERYQERLEGVRGIGVPIDQAGVERNYAYYPIVLSPEEFGAHRDEVFSVLALNGIGARKYFYPLVSDFECYRSRFDSNATPVARKVSSNVLTLPLFADLSIADVDRICDVILMCG